MKRRVFAVSMKRPGVTLFLAIVLSISIESSTSLTLRVASWNLLAQCYVKPYKYPHCDPNHLEWEHRKSLMVKRMLAVQADIFCLQEVQVDLWPELYQTICQQDDGYNGVIQNVTKGHNVGNAILIKKSCGLKFERCESRSRALIGVLTNDKSKHRLYVCNVHLEAGEKEHDNLQRYHQLKSLFKRLTGQIQMDKPKTQTVDQDSSLDEAPIVMMGDFNMLRSNPLHTFLTQGLLQSPEQLKNLPAFRTIQLADAYLECPGAQEHFMASDISDESSDLDGVKEDEIPNNNILQRTYSNGFVLDYIWFSRPIKVQNTLLLHPMTKNRFPQKWPSNDYPSDHLPVAADFEWAS